MFTQKLRLLGRTAMMACAGIDMALWDALAVEQNLPLVRLLGGSIRPIKAYDSHSMDGLELGLLRAGIRSTNGFEAIKTKIGYANLEEDLRIVGHCAKPLGPKTQLLVDYDRG